MILRFLLSVGLIMTGLFVIGENVLFDSIGIPIKLFTYMDSNYETTCIKLCTSSKNI